MLISPLYLQTPNTAAVFSPNGIMDASVLNIFLAVMLFTLCGKYFYFECVLYLRPNMEKMHKFFELFLSQLKLYMVGVAIHT